MEYPDKETFDKEVEERKKLANELNYIRGMVETMKNESHALLMKLTNLLDGVGNTPSLAVQIDRLVNANSHLHERVTGLEEREKKRAEDKESTTRQVIIRVVGALVTAFFSFMAGLWFNSLRM